MLIELTWTALLAAETIPFALYLAYMRNVAHNKPWNLRTDSEFEPKVSVLLPTFNETSVIEQKLSNMLDSDYPHDKMEFIVIDSGSTDGTTDKIERWSSFHPEVIVNLIVENERRGMVHAENLGLAAAKNEVVVKTDADCFWFRESLRNAVKYLSDPTVGAVAGLHKITSNKDGMTLDVEKSYRNLYAWLRIGESKIFSTVLYEGELMLARKKVLEHIGGFDEEIGADDVPVALKVADMLGLRAISAEDAFFLEFAPYTWKIRFSQKIRRARHVVQSLVKYRRTRMNGGASKLFVPMESYIYIANPIIFLLLSIATVPMAATYPILLVGFLALVSKRARQLFVTHSTNSLIMIYAVLDLLAHPSRSLTWSKIEEIRPTVPDIKLKNIE